MLSVDDIERMASAAGMSADELIDSRVGMLDPDERYVIVARYTSRDSITGLGASLYEMSNHLGIPRERVRELLVSATGHLDSILRDDSTGSAAGPCGPVPRPNPGKAAEAGQ